MNYLETIDTELQSYQGLLDTIPFTDLPPISPFLNIYLLNYKDLQKYASSNPFPLDPNKLLKLCISLGNLLKLLQLDEEMYHHQQTQQQNFMSKLGTNRQNPFESPKHFISSTPTNNQPLFQIKFIKNLLNILKNFDIGYIVKDSHHSSTTLNQYANSPIKLNSKQLLIEKLEININLDVLFILKNALKILIKILNVLRKHLIVNGELGLLNNEEQSSIFSSNSVNSGSSDSFITIDEYIKILNQILNRLSNGLVEPLLKYVLGFANANITGEFRTLITSL